MAFWPTHYRCVRKRQEQASPVCQSLGSRRLEEAGERLVLEALQPLGLEAMMEAAQAHAEAAEAERRVAEPELVELVCRLAHDFSDAQVARILHRKGIPTPKGLPFVAHHVANLRHTHGIAPGPQVPTKGQHIYTAQQAGELLGVDGSTVIRWVEAGLLKGGQVTPGAPWRIQVTEDVHLSPRAVRQAAGRPSQPAPGAQVPPGGSPRDTPHSKAEKQAPIIRP